MFKRLFACSFALLVIQQVLAFPNGAPPGPTCGTNELKPKHGNLSTTEGTGPFHVLINTSNVTSLKSADVASGNTTAPPSVKLKIITSSEGFKGFLVQGRTMDGEVVGTFVVPEGSAQSKTLDCPNNRTMASITHTNSDVKMSVEFLWLPPLDYQGGPIVFVASIVQNFSIFYTGIKSSLVTVVAN